MNHTDLKQILSTIHTFEDYEPLKQQIGEELGKAIINKLQLPKLPLMLFPEGTNIVFSYGNNVIKIFPPFHLNQFKNEQAVLRHVDGKLSLQTPKLEYEGELWGWPYLIITKLEGTLLENLWETMAHDNKMIILHELGMLIREVHALPTDGLEGMDCYWPQFLEKQIAQCVKHHQVKGLPKTLLEQLPAYLAAARENLPELKKPVILTGEYTPMNFLVKQVNGVWHISGLIDFGDAMLGLPQYDLLGPGAFLIQGNKQLLQTFLLAYGYLPEELTDALSKQLTALMLLHQYSNLDIQVRIPNWKEKVSNLQDLENLVWGF
ncbi:aminoglycoside phosphotransferase family protein [Fluoribacter dumoffii]|uniref:Aminoglycoside phosphotransferase n=1 Tax=Fluoribacter dumoffii TaxID=463 RepID=A0A377G8C8_9GAMM|nr:aminoglycoside phosphotransferase family protein [Fluoribacter dumoffii]KTC89499.1 Phosphotransferase enzyme family protein [Fluoribacter dumoffii NY 23]MCW8384692.1 aminoglycoside phosphotransferase family protein [Fluoribacter dumoffii]MCW8417756.1 aminoglycoside phosphotransferase family protein [Fluoribacter dumoffii]MCW8454402.1 aminoglycoside phosphotransferase family protein [Fluoribacter dumoffii]MCW8461524.1 aminoglycoside phosphotransferase family protein [Fluoribacter dumoffii]